MSLSVVHNLTRWSIYGLALINVMIHVVFHSMLGYHRDELLYFSMGMHPDFGYATVPPMIGWLATLVQTVFGFSIFAVKIVPALLSGVLVLVTADIVRALGGSFYGRILASIAVMCTPLMLRAFHLYQPVPIDIIFWTLLIYLLIRYMSTESNTYLTLFGITLGFALLNKYLVLLLVFCSIPVVLFTKYRNIFAKRGFYTAGFLAVLIIMPNVFWQITHDFPAIHHIQALRTHQLVHVEISQFLLDQLLMPFASTLIILPGMYYLFFHKEMKPYRPLGWIAILVIVSLILMNGKSYYTAGLFPFFIAVGATFVGKVKIGVIKYLILLILIVATIPVLPIGLPVYRAEGMIAYFRNLEEQYKLDLGRRLEDGNLHPLPQDYADMMGWEEMTEIVSSTYDELENKENCQIYCENYGQAGAITVIGQKYNLPEPLCFHESFLYWSPDKFEHEVKYLIYVGDDLGDEVKKTFKNIKEVGKINNPIAIEYGTKIYLCSNPQKSFEEEWKKAKLKVKRENLNFSFKDFTEPLKYAQQNRYQQFLAGAQAGK